MKTTRSLFVTLGVAGVLIGCAAVPVASVPPRQQVYVQQAGEDDYTRDVNPLYFDAYPGVAFYQRWDAVGCNCIIPVAYYGGAWVTYLGVPVVYRGVWQRPPVHLVVPHRTRLHANPTIYHRAQGRVVVRPAHVAPHVPPPPPARVHVPQQQVKPAALAPRPQQQARPPQQQQRPPQQTKSPPPKKAKCSDGSWKVKC